LKRAIGREVRITGAYSGLSPREILFTESRNHDRQHAGNYFVIRSICKITMPEQFRSQSRTSALSSLRAGLRLRNLGENPAGLETLTRACASLKMTAWKKERGEKGREEREREREREEKKKPEF
jgi:hypothetical protein